MSLSSGSRISPLKQAIGLGPSGSGTSQWWKQGWTAFLLIPLTLWFLAECLRHMSLGTPWVFLSNPFNATLMLLFLAAAFYHLWLGLESVVDDYVHRAATHLFTLIALRFFCLLGFGMSALATLSIALGGLTYDA